MTRRLMTMAAVLVLSATGDAEEAKMAKVDFDVHNGHFESNKSGLKGEASYLAFTDRAAFDAVFGVAFTMGKKPNIVPKDAFEKKLVVAVIKRGNAPVEYKAEQVTTADGKLYVEYTATAKGATTATFASPLILSLDKGKYTSVVYIENGKQVGTAMIGK